MQKQKQVHVRIPEKVYRKLKAICVYEDTSVQDYVVKLIAESMGEHYAKLLGKAGLSIQEEAIPKHSVLIVDDEPIIRESLKDWLKDAYEVVTAETGEEALGLLEK